MKKDCKNKNPKASSKKNTNKKANVGKPLTIEELRKLPIPEK